MATEKAQVKLSGVFRPGSRVRLVKVAGDHVLRSEGGEVVEEVRTDDDGVTTFKKGVVGERYFAVGRVDGQPVERRITARSGASAVGALSQPAVQPDNVPQRHKVDPDSEPFGTRLAQEQVGDDVPQRSATPHGTAHPVDPDERGPYPSQGDPEFSSGKVEQRSDTPLGQATPIADRVDRQEETEGKVAQRSDTPQGVATPLPQGDAVDAVRGIESAEVKAAAGEPSQADARGVAGLSSAAKESRVRQPKDSPPPASPREVAEADAAERDGARKAEVAAAVDAAKPPAKRAAAKKSARGGRK